MKTVLLDKTKHDRNKFNCGVEPLNNYLRVMASQQAKKDNIRTYVVEDEENSAQVIGFYSLTMTPIDLSHLPTKLQKKHQFSNSAGLIARLAVDETFKGQGIGEWLLVDALKKLLQASDTVGFPLVIVDAKDGAKMFYEKYGFIPFQDAENKLFITIANIRASFS